MMDPQNGEFENLLQQARTGDDSAVDRLLQLHRDRLRGMIICRMDERLAPRVDASDVVQDTMLEASLRLGDYLRALERLHSTLDKELR